MERLTKRDKEDNAYWNGKNGVSYSDVKGNIYGNAITKLAEYEDAEEQGLLLRLPCKVGDTVWELCKCNDGVYRIFPMVVKQVIPYGAIRWVKGKEPATWNIYAQSDYTDMYKRFYDIGETVFLTKEKAEQALVDMKGV